MSACHFNRLFHPLCFVTLGFVLFRFAYAFFICFHFFLNNGVLVCHQSYHSYLHTVKNRKKAVENEKTATNLKESTIIWQWTRETRKKRTHARTHEKEPDLNGSNLENCKSSDKKYDELHFKQSTLSLCRALLSVVSTMSVSEKNGFAWYFTFGTHTRNVYGWLLASCTHKKV